MDFAAVIAALIAAYNHRDAAEDRQDAFVDTLMPEVAKYFTALFKGEEDSLFSALNSLVLAAYHVAPDTLQFFIRLMANMSVEKLQGRWPAWVSLPIMVFVKGYFTALEEATKDKAKPTVDDVKEAGRKAAAKAKDTADELGKKFKAAKEAAKGVNIPPDSASPPPPGGPVPHDSHAPPSGGAPPAAGGTGNKKSWGERFSDMVAMLPVFKEGYASAKEHLSDMVEGAEEVAKNLAYALIGIVFAMVLTGLVHGIIVVKAPEWVWAVTVVFTLLWGLLPLCIGLAAVVKSKNGFVKLASAGTAILLTGGVSSLVIATIDGFAVFGKHFSWVYVASGLAAIVLADFIWRLGDMFGDAIKALIRLMPDRWEADWMRRGTIGFRKAMFTIAVAYSAFMFLVGLYAQWEHTLYGIGAVGMLVLCLLMAAYGYSRVSLTVNDSANDLNAVVTVHRLQNLERFYWAATGLSLVLLMGTFVFNAIVPPQCPDKDGDPKTADVCETEELPSYAKRWAGSGLKKIGDDLGSEVVGGGGSSVAANTCSAEVTSLVKRIRWDDCKVALQESTNSEELRLCNEAVSCGALKEDGSKKSVAVRKVGPGDAGFNWWWFGIPAGIAAFLALAWIGRKDPEAGKEKKEGTKPAAH